MTKITDNFMREMISRTRNYCVVILKAGPNRNMHGAEKIIWEHARRNFAIRARGLLPIICPVMDGSEISGVGILNAEISEVLSQMDEDPAEKEGVFSYEIHSCRSFPGDSLLEEKDHATIRLS